ncbi:MAG: PorV/PorQ family protein [Candidatus Marinimicrobia bacterium]|nr:PorV/PorQ family protein [Candidatus Neomarinimicrobiota bacterium]
MKKLVYTLLITGLFLSGISTSRLSAGSEKRKGTSAAAQLMIPVGARDLAMGGSSVAYTYGIEAIYWNPAGLALTKHNADIMVSSMNYIADIDINYFAVSGNFSRLGTLAFSIKSISFGDIPVTTENAPDGTGGTFSPSFFTTGLTYAKMLTDRVFVGATLNLISEEIQRVRSTGASLTVGVQYHDFMNIPGLNMGVVIKDVGTQMAYDGPGLLREAEVVEGNRGLSFYKIQAASFDLPTTMELGISYRLTMPGNSNIFLGGTFQNNNYSNDEFRVGGEYSFADMVFVRAGQTIALDERDNSYLFGMTFGGGVNLNLTGLAVTVDYAFRNVDIFPEANQVLSIKIGF